MSTCSVSSYGRGLFCSVDDKNVPTDKRGFAITNGAGAVPKVKMVRGREQVALRFISILCPMNDAMRILPGAQDSFLPYIGQLTAVLADPDSYMFWMPKIWHPFFAFARKVRGDALGGSSSEQLRPALTVVPMGWTSAVTLIQAAIRHIAYSIQGAKQARHPERLTLARRGQPHNPLPGQL